MDPNIQLALSRPGTIDITTTGRKSGAARRVEIVPVSLGDDVGLIGALPLVASGIDERPAPAQTRSSIQHPTPVAAQSG